MSRFGLSFVLLVAGLGEAGLRAQGAVGSMLAQWTFESAQPPGKGPFTPEFGSGSATGSTSGAWTKPAGNGSAESWCSNRWAAGDYFEFVVDTDGVARFEVSWAQVGSATGPRDFALSYSLDGEKFQWLFDYSVSASSWSGTQKLAASRYGADLDLSAPHRGQIWFRLTAVSTASASGAGVLAKGSSRVDDFTVVGKSAEPAQSESQ